MKIISVALALVLIAGCGPKPPGPPGPAAPLHQEPPHTPLGEPSDAPGEEAARPLVLQSAQRRADSRVFIASGPISTGSASSSKPNLAPPSDGNWNYPETGGATSVSAGTQQQHVARLSNDEPSSAEDKKGANNREQADPNKKTPPDQSNKQSDLDITQAIRKAIMADDAFSFNAKNVKIITIKAVVTLRGPVNSTLEREGIVAIAKKTPGVVRVEDQIEVKP